MIDMAAEVQKKIDEATSKYRRALQDLLDQVDSLDSYELTRDLDAHEAEDCWEDALEYARKLLKETT